MEIRNAALVLFSGGQDSTVCLAWALKNFDRVETIGFDYGQRHIVELECRNMVLAELCRQFPEWDKKLGEDRVLKLDLLKEIGASALTGDAEITMAENGLPTTFVPGRNLLFLTAAAAVAYRRGIRVMVGGMCETDYSGYPDCRNDTIQAMSRALNLGMDTEFAIETPLMWIDKAQTWRMANDLGGATLIDLIVEHTHTCYFGERSQRHDWGYGCGKCPACALRARGYGMYLGALPRDCAPGTLRPRFGQTTT